MRGILFYVLIAVFPFGVLFKFSPFPSLNIAAQDVLVILILLISWRQILVFMKKENNIFVKLLAVFFVIASIGVITHTENLYQFISSISYLLRMYAYLLLLIPLINLDVISLKRLKYGMIGSGLIFILFGYLQYIYYPNLRNLFYLGWDEHLYRLFSTFLDPNFAGSYILLILFLYISVFLEKYKQGLLKLNVLLLTPFVFIIPSLFLTYSRSALLTGVFMTVVFLLLLGKKKLIAIFFIFLLITLFVLPKNFGGEGVNLMRTASIFARIQSNSQAITIFKDNPIIGVGFNTLRFTQDKYSYVLKSEVLTSHAAAGFPNSFLVILTTTGLFGAVIFLIFIITVIKKSYAVMFQSRVKNKFALQLAFFVSLCGMLFNSLFENVVFFAPIMIWLVLLYGVSRQKNS